MQEALTTATMVELAGGDGLDSRAMDREMQTKAEGMRRVLEMADTQRLETMREVVALLWPPQVVHFLLAAAELHLAVHDFRRHKDGHGPPHPAIPVSLLCGPAPSTGRCPLGGLSCHHACRCAACRSFPTLLLLWTG